MHYKYVIDLDERGQFQAHVEDHDGKTVWEVSYPEYYQDDETGEEMENSTIFEDGYMKDTEDIDGLEKYLKQMGTMPQEAELKSEDEFEEEDEDEDEFAEGGYNPAQEIIDSIYGSAGKVYRVVADIGDNKVGMTPYYTKAVIEDVMKEVTDKGYKIINVEEKDDSYMEGGEIKEYKGTKSFTVNFKTYRNFPAAWRVIFFWGELTKPFVEVTKVTNNPYGGRLGTDFETLDKAIAHYKSPELKVLLMQAADVAKKAGVPMDKFADGGMMARGGKTASDETVYIEYFNKAKKFAKDKKEFTGQNAYNEAVTWGRKNIGNFNLDMVKFKMADGGTVKFQDVDAGDSALVKSENKMGVIMKAYGRKFHLKFVDGTEKTYDANELKFFKDEKMAKGGVIGSSPTKEGIQNVIGKYYFSSNISLHQRGDTNEYDVHNAKGKVNGVKVVEKKGRYQFVEDSNKMADGGKTKSFKEMTYKEKSASIQAKLKGSKVSPKYQKLYGKTYDSKEAKQAADAITGKIVSKMKE